MSQLLRAPSPIPTADITIPTRARVNPSQRATQSNDANYAAPFGDLNNLRFKSPETKRCETHRIIFKIGVTIGGVGILGCVGLIMTNAGLVANQKEPLSLKQIEILGGVFGSLTVGSFATAIANYMAAQRVQARMQPDAEEMVDVIITTPATSSN